jgi:hypothetical protein
MMPMLNLCNVQNKFGQRVSLAHDSQTVHLYLFKQHVFASDDRLYTSGRILGTEWAASNIIHGISLCRLAQFEIGQAVSRYYGIL